MAKKVYKKDKKIIITGLLLESGNIGTDGTIIDVKGINLNKITSECYVSRNFSNDLNDIIGTAKVYVEKDVLKCDMVLFKDILSGYPAIGGQIIKKEGNVIKDFKLTSVSISASRNADESIPPLYKQIGDNIEIEK